MSRPRHTTAPAAGTKMGTSKGNVVELRMTADETAKKIKGAKTDSERFITYDTDTRPEVANLLEIIGLCEGVPAATVAARPANLEDIGEVRVEAEHEWRHDRRQPVVAEREPLIQHPVGDDHHARQMQRSARNADRAVLGNVQVGEIDGDEGIVLLDGRAQEQRLLLPEPEREP